MLSVCGRRQALSLCHDGLPTDMSLTRVFAPLSPETEYGMMLIQPVILIPNGA